MNCPHFILKGSDDVELVLDGIYEDKTGRLFQLDKAIDLYSQGQWIYLVEVSTGIAQDIKHHDMEAYLRGGALKNTGTCCRCNTAVPSKRILAF